LFQFIISTFTLVFGNNQLVTLIYILDYIKKLVLYCIQQSHTTTAFLLTQRQIKLIFEGANRNQDDVNDPANSKQTDRKQVEEASTDLTHIKPVYAKHAQEDAK